MVTKRVDASQRVPFDSGSREPIAEDKLALELVPSFDDPGASRPPWQTVRLFPALNGVNVEASRGDVEYTGTSGQLSRSEFVEFNGSRTSSVQYPIDGGSIQPVVKFAYDLDGNEIGANFLSFVAYNNQKEIVCNREFVGAVQIDYVSSYKIYRYQPEDGVIYSPTGQLLFANYGTILAFKDQQFATLEIQPPTLNFDQSSFKKELYRVVSVIQVNENGPWEKIEDFDTGSSWPDGNAPADGDSLFEYERVHEIGYVSTFHRGFVNYETRSIAFEQGPASGDYVPDTLEAQFKSPSDFQSDFLDAYNQISIDSAIAGIRDRWGSGITITE